MKTLKRSFSMMVIALLVVSTFFFGDLGIDASAYLMIDPLNVELEPQTKVQMPETIYLNPADQSTPYDFKYYVDSGNSGDIHRNATQTTGNIYFECSAACTKIELSVASGTTFTTNASISGRIANWTITSGTTNVYRGPVTVTITYRLASESTDRKIERNVYMYSPRLNASVGMGGSHKYKTSVGNEPIGNGFFFIAGLHRASGGYSAYADQPNTSSSKGAIGVSPLVQMPSAPTGDSDGYVDNMSIFQETTYGDGDSGTSGGWKHNGRHRNSSTSKTWPDDTANYNHGYITIDKSRYTDYTQIPFLLGGFWLLRSNESSERHTFNLQSTDNSMVVFTSRDYRNEGNGVAYGTVSPTGAIPAASTTLTMNGQMHFERSSSSHVTVNLNFYLDITVVDKGTLRSYIYEAIRPGWQRDSFNNSTWAGYVDTLNQAVLAGSTVLGNPEATPAEVTTATDTLLNAWTNCNNYVNANFTGGENPDILNPNPTFYVPEVIFMNSAGTGSQYFYGVNTSGAVTGNMALSTAAAGALVYWNLSGATSVRITCELSSNAFSGNTGSGYAAPSSTATTTSGISSMTVGGVARATTAAASTGWTGTSSYNNNMTALTVASAIGVNTYRFLKWTATYVYRKQTYTQYAYTILFNNNQSYNVWCECSNSISGHSDANGKIRLNINGVNWGANSSGTTTDDSGRTQTSSAQLIYDSTRFSNGSYYPNFTAWYSDASWQTKGSGSVGGFAPMTIGTGATQISAALGGTITVQATTYNTYKSQSANATAVFNIATQGVNKGTLRSNYWSWVRTQRPRAWHNATQYDAYQLTLIQAAAALALPGSTATSATAPNADPKVLSREVGTASANHYASQARWDGTTLLGSESSAYTYGDNMYAGFNQYVGYSPSTWSCTCGSTTLNENSTDDGINVIDRDGDGATETGLIYNVDKGSSYAWTFYYSPNKYDVTYDLNGGTWTYTGSPVIDGNKYTYTDAATYDQYYNLRTELPTRTGYTFIGWNFTGDQVTYKGGNNNEKVVWNYPDDNQSFVARWTPNDYLVHFDNEISTKAWLDTITDVGGSEPAGGWTTKSMTKSTTTPSITLTAIPSDATVSTVDVFTNKYNGTGAYTTQLEEGKTYRFTTYFTKKNATGDQLTAGSDPSPMTYLFFYPDSSAAWAQVYSPYTTSKAYEYLDDGVFRQQFTFTVPSGYPYMSFRLGTSISGTITYYEVHVQDVTHVVGASSVGVPTSLTSTGTFDETYADLVSEHGVDGLPTVTKTGYVFQGWYTGKNGTGTKINNTDNFVSPAASVVSVTTAGEQHLWSHWTVATYTITFDVNTNGGTFVAGGGFTAGTANQTKTVTYASTHGATDGSKTWPSNPTRTGYTFKGWYTAATGGTKTETGTTVSYAGNRTLYAQFEPNKYTVTFNFQSGTVAAGNGFSAGTANQTKSVTYNSTYGASDGSKTWPNNPTRTGYDFKGWYNASSGGTAITTSTTVKITAAQTIYAQWTPHTYKVVYHGNGGTTSSGATTYTQDCNYGTSYTYAAANTFSRPGYSFKEWYNNATGSGGTAYAPGAAFSNLTTETGAEITRYAVWQTVTYTVTYDANSGSSVASKTYTIEDAFTLATTSRTGYTFQNWKVTTAAGNWTANATFTAGASVSKKYGNVTLTAQWAINNSKVKFVMNGGSMTVGSTAVSGNATEISGNYNTTLSLPVPTRTAYTFNTWTLTKASGNTSAISIASNKTATYTFGTGSGTTDTLTASWTANNYTLTYNANGGAAVAARSYTIEDAFALPTTTRTGYTFANWKVTTAAGNWTSAATFNASESVSGKWGNATLTAQWTPNSYTLVLAENGGSAVNDITYNIESTTTLPTITRTGYTFGGWKVTTAGGSWTLNTVKAANAAVTGNYGNATLTAQWTINSSKVALEMNGGVGSYTQNSTTTAIDGDVTITGNYNTIISIALPTKTGYSFAGWTLTKATGNTGSMVSSSTTGASSYKFGTGSGTTDTLTAAWTANTYTVTFNPQSGTFSAANGFTAGTAAQNKTVTYDSTYGTADASGKAWPTVTRTGYSLKGWYTATTGGNAVTSSTKVTSTTDHTLYAQWNPNTYTVTFAAGEGTPSFTQKTVYYGSAYGAADTNGRTWPTVTRTGYDLIGWFTAETGGELIDSKTIVATAQSHTLYAQYEVTKYTFTFVVSANGGTFTSGNGFTGTGDTNKKVVTYGDVINATVDGKTWPADPTRTGYSFKGWYTAATGGTKVTGAEVANVNTSFITLGQNDYNFYAQFTAKTFTLTFDATGGTVDENYADGKKVTYDKAYGLPDPNGLEWPEDGTTVRPGYVFDGWWSAAVNGNEVSPSDIYKTDGDSSVYAHWIANKYTVTFDATTNGGTFTAGNGFTASSLSKTVTFGSAYNLADGTKTFPAAPTKQGYTFDGWFTQATGGTVVIDSTPVAIPENHTLYAQFSANAFKVTFNATQNGGTFTAGNGFTAADNSKYVIYSFTYGADDNGKTWPADPTKTGYAFTGWYFANSADAVTPDTVVEISADTTIYARFVANTYKVTFDAGVGGTFTAGNGFTADDTTKTVTYDATYGVADGNKTWPAAPTKTGYTFADWCLGENVITSDTIVAVTKDVTLVADYTANKYTVTFDAVTNGGTFTAGNGLTAVINNKTVTFDGTYGEADADGKTWPANPAKTGFTFTGWFTQATGGEKIESTDTMTFASNIILVAQFSRNNYNLTVKQVGKGTATASYSDQAAASQTVTATTAGAVASVPYDYDVTLAATPATGYTFTGWTASGITLSGSAFKMPAHAVTLTATFTANRYTITFNADGGSVVSSINYTIDNAITLPATTKTGYIFGGWKPTATVNNWLADTVYKGTVDAGKYGDVTLKAVWTPITYTIIFDGNGESDGYMEDLICNYDEDVTIPWSEFIKDGYLFEGWATSENGEAVYEENSTVKNLTTLDGAEITLYAKWAPITYNLIYDPGEGTGEAKTYVLSYDESYTALGYNDAELGYYKTGYDFICWTSDVGEFYEGDEILNLTPDQDGEIIFTAVWEAVADYVLVYDRNGYEDAGAEDGGVVYVGGKEWPADQTDCGLGAIVTLDNIYDSDTDYVYLNDSANYERRYIIGWTTEEGGTTVEYELGSDLEITEDIAAIIEADGDKQLTLYAVWSANYLDLDYAIADFQAMHIVYDGSEEYVHESAIDGNSIVQAFLPASDNYDIGYTQSGGDYVDEITWRGDEGYLDGYNGEYGYSSERYGYYNWVVGDSADENNDFTEETVAAINDAYAAAVEARIELPMTDFLNGAILTQDDEGLLADLMMGISIDSDAMYELQLKTPDLDYRIKAEDVENTDLTDACSGGYEMDAEIAEFLGVEVGTYPACEYDEADGTYHSFNSLIALCNEVINVFVPGAGSVEAGNLPDFSAENDDSIYTVDSVNLLYQILYQGDDPLFYRVYDTDGVTLKVRRPSQYYVNEVTAMIAEAYHDLEVKEANYDLFISTYDDYVDEYWEVIKGCGIDLSRDNLVNYFTEESITILDLFFEDVLSEGGDIRYALKVMEQDFIDGQENGEFKEGTLAAQLCDLIEQLQPLPGNYTEIFKLISTIPYDTSMASPYPEGFEGGSSILTSAQYNEWFSNYANADAYESGKYDTEYLNNYYTADSVADLKKAIEEIDWTYDAFSQNKINGSDSTSIKSVLQAAINGLVPKEFTVVLLANYDVNLDGEVNSLDQLAAFTGNTTAVKYHYGSTCNAIYGPANYGGWTFVEWNSMADGTGEKFEMYDLNNHFDFVINNNTPGLDPETNTIYIYAIWETNTSRVKFELSGGSVTVTQNGLDKVVTDSNNTTLTGDFATTVTFGVPSRTGYTFSEWTLTVAEGNANSSLTKQGATYVYTFGEGINTTDTITAKWTANSYTVSFSKNAADATGTMDDQSFTYGVAQALTENAYKRVGYTFIGWSKTSTGSVDYVDNAMIGASNAPATENGATVTLYAVWEQTGYILTIDPANGSAATEQSLACGDTYEIPAAVKTGYTFASWSITEDNSENVAATISGSTFTMGDGNVTVTANWTANKYTIAFNGNGETGGSTASMINCEYDSTYALTANGFEKTGHTFLGWSITKNGAVIYTDKDEVKNLSAENGATVTLYAVWDVLGYTLTVTNDGKGTATASYTGADDVTSGVVDFADTVTVTATADTGYHFDKWVVVTGDASVSDEASATATFSMPAEDVELKATFAANTYTVAFDKNHEDATGEMETQTFTYDVDQKLSAGTFERIGYTFSGWSRTASGSVDVADGASIGASNALTTDNGATVTLYAVWTQETYTLTIDPANGDATSEQSLVYGGTYAIPEVTKTGYTFASWSVTADEGKNVATAVAGNTVVMGDGDATVTAQWTPIKYTIAFNGNGATSGNTESMTGCAYDSDITLTANGFENTGYSFKGWAVEAGGAVKYADKATVKNLSATEGATVTLYAVWGVLGYNLTVTNDGHGTATASFATLNGVTSGEVDYKDTVTLKATAAAGYHFDKWVQVEGEIALSDETSETATFAMPAYDVEVKATFAPNTYAVTFDATTGTFTDGNGFTADSTTKTVTYDATYGADVDGKTWPNNPTKTGYTFTGWFTAAEGGMKVIATDTVKITADRTLFAQYTVNTYTLTVTNDGYGTATASYTDASDVTNGTVVYGDTVTLNATAKTGYHFSNWSVTEGSAELASATSETTTFDMPANDLTVKAIFAPNTYTVTFDAADGTFTEGNGFAADDTAKTVTFMSTYGADADGKTWPAEPVKAGHTFLGWFTETTGGTQITAASTVEITSAQTLYAQYQVIKYTLTVDPANGDAVTTVELDFAGSYTLPTVTRTGYAFDAWTIAADSSETTAAVIADGKVVIGDGDATVKATWTANTYTVVFNANGGTGEMADQTFTYDVEYNLTVNAFELTGFRFRNWTTNEDGTGETFANGAKVKNLCTGAAGDTTITLYAQWSLNDFSLTFNVAQNGGKFAAGNGFAAGTNDQSKTITYDSAYGATDGTGKSWPIAPTKTVTIAGETYTIEFIGWYTEADGGTLVTSATTVTVVGDHTLYARWISTDELVEALDKALEINANHYTEESLVALDEVIISILSAETITGDAVTDGSAAIAKAISELDIMENDGATPKINVFENKDVVAAEVNADGTYDEAILTQSQNLGDISFVYPGKAYYTYYCYTNSANPMILINTADLVSTETGRVSYPTTIDVDEEGVNAKGQLLTRTGQVNSGWMNYTVDTDTSERSAGYTIYNKSVDNPYEGVLTYAGSAHAEDGEVSENYDYYQNSEYIVLTPTFVQRNSGKKQYALYTISATDDSYNAQKAETASLAGAEGYGDYAEGTSIATSSNTSVTPNYTVTIFVEYYNTMAQNDDGSYRTDAGGQNTKDTGVGTHNGGKYIEVYNQLTASDDDWVYVDYVYRSLAGVTDDDIIKPQAVGADGKYASYLGNDPEFGQNDRGSFYSVIASDNPAVEAYWNAYDAAIAAGKTVNDAREAGGLAATPIMNEQVAADIENGTFTMTNMDKSQQAVRTNAGEYVAWPYTTSTKYYSQFYASARTREESLVYAHFYDRYGNEFTNVLVRDLQDNERPTATYTERGQVVVTETGGSAIQEIKITKYNMGGSVLQVEPLADYLDGAVWNEAGNQFSVHLGVGEDYYKYSLNVRDNAGLFADVDFLVDEDGNVTVTIFDEVMGGTYADSALTPPEQIEVEEASSAAPEMSLMTVEPVAIEETQEDVLASAAPAVIAEEVVEEALPDVYTFSLNGYYTVNLFAKVGRDYDLTLKTTTGGIIKAYVDGVFASPEAGKITVPGGSEVQIKVATNAGYELSSLTMLYADGSAVTLDGSYVAEIDDDVVIKAVFKKTEAVNTVTVENGMINGKTIAKVSPYSQVSVVANEAPAGMKFAYWAVGGADGTPVSYDKIYTFVVTGDTALTAVYTEDDVTKIASVAMDAASDSHITVVNDRFSLSYSGKLTLPEGYEIVEFGMVLSNQDAQYYTSDNMVIGGVVNGVATVKIVGETLNEQGQCKLNINNVAAGVTRAGRLFMTVRDADGNEFTVYSDTWSVLTTPVA